MPSKIYPPSNIPAGTSWVYELSASDAIAQCEIFGISPQSTLTQNRALLSHFLAALELNGGTEPLPQNFRPDLTLPDDDPTHHTSAVTTLPSTTVESVSLDQHLVHFQQPATTSFVAIPSQTQTTPATTMPVTSHRVDAVHPPSVSPQWHEVLQTTVAALGQQFANALSQRKTSTESRRVVSDLLRALPVTAGTDGELLLTFLVKLIKIDQLRLTDQHSLLVEALPKTAGQLRSFWSQAISDRQTLSSLSARLLDFFIPTQLRHTMVTKLIYRAQAPTETLPEFVDNIRDHAMILLPHASDRELLDVVVNGLSPSIRAKLAGLPPPLSLQDLLSLAPRIAVVANLEGGIPVPSAQPYQSASHRPNGNFTHHTSRFPHNYHRDQHPAGNRLRVWSSQSRPVPNNQAGGFSHHQPAQQRFTQPYIPRFPFGNSNPSTTFQSNRNQTNISNSTNGRGGRK